jgi:hypothetical protein
MVYKTDLIVTVCCNAQIKYTIDSNNVITINCDNCDGEVLKTYLPKIITNMLILNSQEI